MSLEAMVWALKYAPVDDALAHLVLIGLADHASGDGSAAFPTVATLAEYARCSPRTVQNRLRTLEAEGLIRRGDQRLVAHRAANRRPVVYDLAMSGVHGMHPSVGLGVHGGAPWGAQPGSPGVHAVADKPSLNQPEPSFTPSTVVDGASVAADEAFEVFWSAYPRTVGKRAARKAWDKATARAEAQVVIDGARRLAADPNLPEARFVPHPSTWLNRDGWEDAPYPVDTSRQATTTARVSQAMDVARRMAEAEGAPRAIGGSGLW